MSKKKLKSFTNNINQTIFCQNKKNYVPSSPCALSDTITNRSVTAAADNERFGHFLKGGHRRKNDENFFSLRWINRQHLVTHLSERKFMLSSYLQWCRLAFCFHLLYRSENVIKMHKRKKIGFPLWSGL